MKKRTPKKADAILSSTVLLIVAFGFIVFFSAALGLYARDGAEFSGVVMSQTVSVILGFVLLVVVSHIPYTFWKKYALPIFIASATLMALVLMPDIGLLHGGSRRWLVLGPVSIQPSEFFKVATVIFYAAFLAKHKASIRQWRTSVLSFLSIFGISALFFLLQPKIGTLIVLGIALGVMLVVSGARLRHISSLVPIMIPVILLILLLLPYARERVETYLHPDVEPLGSGYQAQQSLIAVGSGEWFGRGYGQSIQKFTFLPEPIGDSIFSVAAEELGFVGASFIVVLFLVFAYRGFLISARAPDTFSRLLVLGLVILIVAQSFVNIAAMLQLAPLTGLPLIFISHGGTAMLAALGSVGIMLNVSRYTRS